MTAAEFNAEHPTGSKVRFWPKTVRGHGIVSITRSAAWDDPDGTAKVFVHGHPVGVPLTHIRAAVNA